MKQIILFIIVLFICSCSLFKKTSRTSDTTKKSSLNQLESTQLVLKNIDKETQIFTYWNDSGFYQYQLIKERSKESVNNQLNTKEVLTSKEKQSKKQSEPVNIWAYIVFLLLLAVSFFLFKRFSCYNRF